MDMGTAIGPEGWRTGQDLLAELYSKAQLAYRELDNLFNEQARYFHEKAEAIIDAFDLTSEKAYLLLDFAEKLVDCLYRAYPQSEAKLQKLLTALENSNVKVELSQRGTKTLHVRPVDENWYIIATRRRERKTWIFSMPIHGVSAEAEFPDLLNLSDQDLYYLQAGWRASDEGEESIWPKMETTQTWQVLAWVAIRSGLQQIAIHRLNLNMKKPSISWLIIAKSWEQQWRTPEGKVLAQKEAEQNVLGLLTWYLGDGRRHKRDYIYKVGNNDKYKSKSIIADIVKEAYRTRYGTLLDIIESDKWATLKSLQSRWNPVHAELAGYTFLLSWTGKPQASIQFKTQQEAQKCIETLREHGITQIRTTLNKKKYIRVYFTTHEVLKLAENYQEWRKALKQLAEKHGLQPKTPMLRRLLELAENPPPALQR
uniref:Uncharacterized protein n=1 Tax=Thermofilum adornatum TaxID=1365176 RepID=A0A7C1CEU0_9CREN